MPLTTRHRLSVRPRRGMTNKQWAERTLGKVFDRMIDRMKDLAKRIDALELARAQSVNADGVAQVVV